MLLQNTGGTMDFMACSRGRTFMARFDAGEDLLSSLERFAKENRISAGHFSIIGGLKKLSYGLLGKGGHRVLKYEAERCFEILPTFGNITLKDGEVMIHAHIAAADEEEGVLRGGHLSEGCEIYPFAEVVIEELSPPIHRNYDSSTNLWPLNFKRGG